jgi:hypothetical protein
MKTISKNKILGTMFLVALIIFAVFACKAVGIGGNSGGEDVAAAAANTVAWSLSATAPDAARNAVLSFTFGNDVDGFNVNFDRLVKAGEIKKPGAAGLYQMDVSDIPDVETITVTVEKSGTNFEPASRIWNVEKGSTEAPESAPPGPVANFTGVAGIASVILNWTDPPDAGLAKVNITFTPEKAGVTQPIVVNGGSEALTVKQGGLSVSSLDNGTAYTFTAVTENTSGQKGPPVVAGPYTPYVQDLSDTTPPSPVTGLGGAPGSNNVTLSWTNPPDADLHHIHITWTPGGSGGIDVLAPANNTKIINNLSAENDYTFSVAAVDANDNMSTVETTGPVRPLDLTPPAEISGLTVLAGYGQVTLDWTANPTDSDFDHIEITHNQPGGTPARVIASNAAKTYTWTPLTNGTAYTFTVKTVDITGNASVGITTTATPIADYYSYELSALSATYPGSAANQIQNFDAGVVNYSFNTDSSHQAGTVDISVTAKSPVATVSIQVRGESAFPDGTTAAVTLPGAGVYRFVDITVTSPQAADMGLGGSRTYTVTILGYTPMATWSAAVANVPASFTITAVTMFDTGSPKIAIAMQEGGGTYQAQTSLGYDGKTFVVSMNGAGTSYSTQAMSPAISVTGSNHSVILDLTGVPYGLTISNATELYNLTDPAKSALNWSVIADITLPSSPAWDGPDNFTGKLYGNGHSITMQLTKTTGNTGLFDSLANGAEIHDLTLNVTTPTALAMSGQNYFGGLVGIVSIPSGAITIRGVTVNGKLEYSSVKVQANSYLVVGGFFGGMQTGNNATVNIANCVSNLDIEVDSHPSADTGGYQDFGGFIGCKRGPVVITNSYATGNITVSAENCRVLTAGGLVARNDVGTLSIDHCYATGAIAINKSGTSAVGNSMYAGGLVGFNNAGTATISNSAAINPSVTVNNVGTRATNRILGYGSASLTNNFALSGMITGDKPGTANTAAGSETTVEGLAKTESQLRTESTWTNQAASGGLGFAAAVWDFSPLSSGAWPVLK